jgi:hypothetical protein
MTDDELLLFHFSDGLTPERVAQIQIALDGDATLRERLAQLRAHLAALNHAGEDTLPDAVQRRLQLKLQQLHEASRAPARLPFWRTPRAQSPWLLPAFAAGAGALVMWLYTQGVTPNTQPLATEHGASEQVVSNPEQAQTMSLPALRAHLLQTRALLETFDANNAQERALLSEIIAQNQNYAMRAQRLGRADLARVLRALEPVLVAVENLKEPDARAALINQFEFEADSLQTKLQARASKQVPKTI